MRKTILIVAGNRRIRERLARTFSNNGFRILTAADGGGGLLQFGLLQPDLILLDGDEFETLQRIRELSTVPIITFADMHDEETRVRNLNCGADYCLERPIGLEELYARVRALFRRELGVQKQVV